MSAKQQYSSELNHLRIRLTETDDRVMQSKLKEAELMMEKDLLSLRMAECI